MTEIDNDKLLRFLRRKQAEIADNGFSRRSCTTCPTAVTGWHASGLYS